ncbi:MAG: glycosyltransferase family 2 protein [Sphingobacteriales bacterium]|nr:glycosyltransferase family 2 protein [Sphingobacteriales bacterium]
MTKSTLLVLVNWNSFEFTDQCLVSLSYCNQSLFDVVVVDNGSNDGSGEQLKKQHPEIILIPSLSNLGFAGGNNLGIKYAIEQQYTYVMLLNNDTFVEPDFLDVLVDYMNQHPEAGVIQSKIYFNHNRKLLWNAGSYFNRWITLPVTLGYMRTDKPKYNSIKEVDWITGCAFFARTDVIKQSGMLNEKFFIYFEDVDLSFRIKKLGYQLIYHPKSVVYHISGMSNKSKTKQKEGYVHPYVRYLNQRNRIWFVKKYIHPYFILPTIFYHTLYSLAVMVYFLLRGRFKKLSAFLQGTKEGILDSL